MSFFFAFSNELESYSEGNVVYFTIAFNQIPQTIKIQNLVKHSTVDHISEIVSNRDNVSYRSKFELTISHIQSSLVAIIKRLSRNISSPKTLVN